jgi:hypothetical protein
VTQTSRFFDTQSLTETQFAEMTAALISDGVMKGVLNTLAVSAPGGMNVAVNTGQAWVQGFWYQNDASVTKAIAANSSGSTRFDWVVLKLDRAANQVVIDIHQGTAGAGTPALTRVAGGTWELGLALVTVANGAASIVAGNIADQRNVATSSGYTAPAGQVGKMQLDYVVTTDVLVSQGIAAGTFNNLVAASSFNVDDPTSLLLVTVRCGAFVGNTSGSIAEGGGHILIDGTTRYPLSGNTIITGQSGNPSTGGSIVLPGLSAGSHTIAFQFITSQATNITLRAASSSTYEFLGIQVIELKR